MKKLFGKRKRRPTKIPANRISMTPRIPTPSLPDKPNNEEGWTHS